VAAVKQHLNQTLPASDPTPAGAAPTTAAAPAPAGAAALVLGPPNTRDLFASSPPIL
jgi:hypothetical protein